MANVTNQASPGIFFVGGGAVTSTSKSLERRSAWSLGWSVTFEICCCSDKQAVEPTHRVARTKVVSSATGDHPRGFQFGPISHAANSTSEQLKDTAGCQYHQLLVMRCAAVSTRMVGVRLTSVRGVEGLLRCSEKIAPIFVLFVFKEIILVEWQSQYFNLYFKGCCCSGVGLSDSHW